ncbi:MAG: hypothetical protein WDO73_13540 [Ignavibacteriota bacterium]
MPIPAGPAPSVEVKGCRGNESVIETHWSREFVATAGSTCAGVEVNGYCGNEFVIETP